MNKRISHYTPPASRYNNLMILLAEVFKSKLQVKVFKYRTQNTQTPGQKENKEHQNKAFIL